MLKPEFLNLTDNFRSQAGVVNWVNRSFVGLMPRSNDPIAGAIAYSASTAFHDALPGTAVEFHPAWSRGDAEAAEQQAEDIAVTLVRQALKEHKGSKHPVAVLVRARSHLGNLTRRLTQEGISCRAVDLVPLALRPVVADLVQLLRALSHPADRLAWLSVLRAPFCGLTLTSLQRLFGEDHVTPVPVLLERALREPDPAASQTPAQGSLFDAPPVVRGRGPGRTARARRAGRGRVRTPAPGRRRPAGRAQRFRRHALRGLGRGLLAPSRRPGVVHGTIRRQ